MLKNDVLFEIFFPGHFFKRLENRNQYDGAKELIYSRKYKENKP